MAPAPHRCRRRGGRELLDDDLDEAVNIERGHQRCGRRSSSRTLSRRRRYRASRIGVARKVSTISSASGVATSVEPSAITLAPLCSRAYLASVRSVQLAARTPWSLLAAIVDPRPAP